MFENIRNNLVFAAALLLTACASMPSDFQEPAFSVMNIELQNSTGLSPEFIITLRVTNPNRVPLEIIGMSYDILMEGNKVVSGVSNDFPVIGPYEEGAVRVVAQFNLVGSINLLRDLASRNNDSVKYEFIARLDFGSDYPMITIGDSGDLRL